MWTYSVCFLCLKSFDGGNRHNIDFKCRQNLKSKLNTIKSHSFALFCERFLKLPSESALIFILCWGNEHQNPSSSRTSSSSSSWSFLDQVCSQCSEILDATVKLYNELCEVQLKIAWRLSQWEALLKMDENSKSKPSSKLSSLLLQKLSEQLQRDPGLGVGKEVSIYEVRNMRNLLLSHCKSARNQMMEYRMLEVALDRCPTSFSVLDSNPSKKVFDSVVKQELLEDYSHDSHENDRVDEFASPMDDYEMEDDFDFSNANLKKESLSPSSSSSEEYLPEESATVSSTRPRRGRKPKTAKNSNSNKSKVQNVEKGKFEKKKAASTGKDGIPCEVCEKMIPTMKQLKQHNVRHVEVWMKLNEGQRPPFQCHFCYQSFTTQQQRWIHEEIGSHDKAMTSTKFTCYEEACTGVTPFKTFNELETHFENFHQTENGESVHVHKCNLCEWPFSSYDLRQVHELVHGHYVRTVYENKSFKCPTSECSHSFKTFPPLQTHFISEHTNLDSERIYKCHKCPKSYRLPRSLAQHLKNHEVEENLAKSGTSDMSTCYICEECGRRCGTHRFLKEHHRIHHQTELCSLCGEIIQSSKMQRHMRVVHKKVDPARQHACPICNKMFHVKLKMQRHLDNVHKDREVEICHICSKRYTIKGRLQLHLRIAHQIQADELNGETEKSFICPDCGNGYYSQSGLNRHVDAKHRQKPEGRKSLCTLCSKTFRGNWELSKHLEKVHGHGQIQDKHS